MSFRVGVKFVLIFLRLNRTSGTGMIGTTSSAEANRIKVQLFYFFKEQVSVLVIGESIGFEVNEQSDLLTTQQKNSK